MSEKIESPRRMHVARLVAQRGFARVTDLARELGVSEVTLRADLAALERAGLLTRVHGGALGPAASEPTLESSLGTNAGAKAAIGRAAAAQVESGQAVYLDAGSTAVALASALVDRVELRDVTVVTPSLTVALTLEPAIPRLSVVVTGGTLRPLQHSLVNPFADPMLDRLALDVAFIGCNGVHPEHGVTNLNLAEAEIKGRAIDRSARAVVVADASKLGVQELALIAPLDRFDSLVSDGRLEGAAIPQPGV